MIPPCVENQPHRSLLFARLRRVDLHLSRRRHRATKVYKHIFRVNTTQLAHIQSSVRVRGSFLAAVCSGSRPVIIEIQLPVSIILSYPAACVRRLSRFQYETRLSFFFLCFVACLVSGLAVTVVCTGTRGSVICFSIGFS